MTSIATISITALAIFFGASLTHAGPPAEREQPARSGSVKERSSKSAKSAKAGKKPAQPVGYRADQSDKYGSRETEGQRSERLSRECRGAVNAGACAGYTR